MFVFCSCHGRPVSSTFRIDAGEDAPRRSRGAETAASTTSRTRSPPRQRSCADGPGGLRRRIQAVPRAHAARDGSRAPRSGRPHPVAIHTRAHSLFAVCDHAFSVQPVFLRNRLDRSSVNVVPLGAFGRDRLLVSLEAGHSPEFPPQSLRVCLGVGAQQDREGAESHGQCWQAPVLQPGEDRRCFSTECSIDRRRMVCPPAGSLRWCWAWAWFLAGVAGAFAGSRNRWSVFFVPCLAFQRQRSSDPSFCCAHRVPSVSRSGLFLQALRSVDESVQVVRPECSVRQYGVILLVRRILVRRILDPEPAQLSVAWCDSFQRSGS